MDECREMHQLDRRRDCNRAVLAGAFDLAGQQRERRTEQLPAHAQEMSAHLLDHREIADDHAMELRYDALEPRTDRRLHARERDVLRARRSGGGHGAAHRAAFSSAFSRSATSWNWMSTTKTRW